MKYHESYLPSIYISNITTQTEINDICMYVQITMHVFKITKFYDVWLSSTTLAIWHIEIMLSNGINSYNYFHHTHIQVAF